MGSANPQQFSHALTQYLNSLLSQRGANALPYDENMKWSIRQQLLSAIQEFPGLQATPSKFTHNDGKIALLLHLEGTIPMYYQAVKYNIPITLWLTESFPRVRPLVYVTPTKDMIIKPRHTHVDSSGLVTLPYLREWVYPRSNILDLLKICSQMFGAEPPLYSRPNPPNLQSNPQSSQKIVSPTSTTNSSASSTLGANPVPISGAQYASGPGPTHAISQNYSNKDGASSNQSTSDKAMDPNQAFRNMAIATLTERFKTDIEAERHNLASEMEHLFSSQRSLGLHAQTLDSVLLQLSREKELLEQNLQDVMTNKNVLEEWLLANRKVQKEDVSIDSVFEPVDIWSKQALDCTMTDMAIEDLLYALDKAVQEDINGNRVISVEAYLRYTRNLSREQFFQRATQLKISGAQTQMKMALIENRLANASLS